jgi:hypothetical protein
MLEANRLQTRRTFGMLDSSTTYTSDVHRGQVRRLEEEIRRRERALHSTNVHESDKQRIDGITIWMEEGTHCVGFHLVNTVNFYLPW